MKKTGVILGIVILVMLAVLIGQSRAAQAAMIFFDNIHAGDSSWSSNGLVDSVATPSLQPNSVRLQQTGQIWRTISGAAGTATNTPTAALLAVPIVPGDPLTGTGNVTRTLLTYNDLISGASTAPVDDSAFALPANAAPPAHIFQGSLQLIGTATNGGFSNIKDTYGYASRAGIQHLPPFNFQFVQNGSYFIPAIQGLYNTGDSNWNYIVGPGRVWNENSDSGYTRASFPFALVERNANCIHNGVMTFLFNDTGVSKVRYQVTQETCQYFYFNMWGQLTATYTPGAVPNATTLQTNEALEVANRLPTKPIAALATDFPNSGVNVSVFGSGVSDMTTYGLFINGINYVSNCPTRYGQYAYCGDMRLASYSTAKSAFTSIGLMRLGQTYGKGTVQNLLIKNYVSEYSHSIGDWSAVTFNNTADMATGNYRLPGFELDENGMSMSTFFADEPYTNKIADAFNWPHKVAPGTKWIYHSSDMFILARAMNNYLQSRAGSSADIFNYVRDEVYTPLKLSAGAMTTVRTDNSPAGAPFGGYGLFWTQGDIAKVGLLLNNQRGMINGVQVLEPTMVDDAMQKNPNDRGLVTSGATAFQYNNAFWALQFTPAQYPQYTCSFYVPFMSGFGGITVAMMPNGGTYWYFSDNGDFSWASSVNEADKLIHQCP